MRASLDIWPADDFEFDCRKEGGSSARGAGGLTSRYTIRYPMDGTSIVDADVAFFVDMFFAVLVVPKPKFDVGWIDWVDSRSRTGLPSLSEVVAMPEIGAHFF